MRSQLRRRRRGGFTLVELLVVIAIIGMLAGLMLPAISSARAAGRRAKCQSNMRQVGIGLLGYLNTFGKFPNAGTFAENPNVDLNDPTDQKHPSTIWLAISKPGSVNAGMYNWVVEILPYLDNKDLANAWDRSQSYLSAASTKASIPSNARISSTHLEVLVCPDDTTVVPSQGNLSYVVNGGFARWPAEPLVWTGYRSDSDTAGGNGNVVACWAPNAPTCSPSGSWQANQAVLKKAGVMFAGTTTGGYPWDVTTRIINIEDGSSSTLMLSENYLVGVSNGSPLAGTATNWACPVPNFCMFVASDNVCGPNFKCPGSQLAPTGSGIDGLGWAAANQAGTAENINGGLNLSLEGSFLYPLSNHANGVNVVFCDGSSRFLKSTIDGTVYAKLITPAGSKLPDWCTQMPVSQDAFAD
jgi:prepilin-type N-terminal cleavage/methylation domain-containing protein/prepilin-type processing-associated H-X9-DG protein